ncbi:MAG: CDP-alcohol phosphatidyltransferase family protein [Neisseriaceae bacterium]|nr:CDP-alcohol phosphatidyltransferase family protein [Neisseriaceae bacterium]MBP6862433.1 CDP-alcohol phosphatidyltransferase family protein [Neisseriaceae bacterium]
MSVENRRPIKARGSRMAGATATWLAKKGVLPNHISVASMGFALLAGFCFWVGLGYAAEGGQRVLLVLAALCIQGRLLCNLFDGMVAVEGGLKTPGGEVYNELPDRVADSLILLGVGYGLSVWPWAAHLGWAAALLAMATAYVRVLGGSCGLAQKFLGPMAKQQRMALLTVAALVGAVVPSDWAAMLLLGALVLIVIGSAWTAWRRTMVVLEDLHERAQ